MHLEVFFFLCEKLKEWKNTHDLFWFHVDTFNRVFALCTALLSLRHFGGKVSLQRLNEVFVCLCSHAFSSFLCVDMLWLFSVGDKFCLHVTEFGSFVTCSRVKIIANLWFIWCSEGHCFYVGKWLERCALPALHAPPKSNPTPTPPSRPHHHHYHQERTLGSLLSLYPSKHQQR